MHPAHLQHQLCPFLESYFREHMAERDLLFHDTVAEALAGAYDIVAETMSDNPDVRQRVREKALKFGTIQVEKIKKAEDEKAVYHLYYEFQTRVDRLRPHQTLAINRGEKEKIVGVKLDVGENDWMLRMRSIYRPNFRQSPLAEALASGELELMRTRDLPREIEL